MAEYLVGWLVPMSCTVFVGRIYVDGSTVACMLVHCTYVLHVLPVLSILSILSID